MNTEKLISLKQNFTGQRFQWIKPTDPSLLAKVVRCRDVDVSSGGKFRVMFDDGSSIDSAKLNSDLLMIHGDMEPLTRSEVESIYSVKARPEPKVAPAPAPASTPNLPPAPQPMAPPQPRVETPASSSNTNMFAMFNSEETTLTLNISVKIPERKLLKMMYLKAENKEKFVNELAEHLQAMINKQVIKNSVQSILAPPPPKKEKGVINLTEVDEA